MPRRKLEGITYEDLLEMKRRIWEGEEQYTIAMSVGLSQPTLSKICNGHIGYGDDVKWPDGSLGRFPDYRRAQLAVKRIEAKKIVYRNRQKNLSIAASGLVTTESGLRHALEVREAASKVAALMDGRAEEDDNAAWDNASLYASIQTETDSEHTSEDEVGDVKYPNGRDPNGNSIQKP